MRPGIDEPTSLWILVGFITTEPQWGLQYAILLTFKFHYQTMLAICPDFFFCLFVFSGAAPMAYGVYQARGLIRAVAAGLCHSHSYAGSEPSLRPTPQLMATPDP